MSASFDHPSEIARLRDQITREHEAARWALNALAVGMAQHRFISRRMERIGVCQKQLAELVGETESMEFLVALLDEQQKAPL